MSLPPTDAELTAALREVLPGVRTAWLFGSAATGRLRADSDLDLAVVPTEPLDALARADAAEALAQRFLRDVDLIDFPRASTVMQMQVLVTGRRLFSADPVADLIGTARTMREYQDLQFRRRPAIAALRERLRPAAHGQELGR